MAVISAARDVKGTHVEGGSLKTYRAKRDFSRTAEPSGEDQGESKSRDERVFVIQKHWASRLHYDFRLELEGAMKSWAVPKGPSFDPNDKRMAVHVEDHPISYNRFEGQIPAGQYGAGKVIIWDKGCWIPLEDPHKGYLDGKLKFELRGLKLKGKWALVRMKNREEEKQEPWLLIKEKDEYVRPANEFSVVDEMPDSVAHRRSQGDLELPAREKDNSRSKQNSSEIAEGAVKASLPLTLQPELATLVDSRREIRRTGFTRSSSTDIACWRGRTARTCASLPATETIGRISCRTW